MMLDKENTLSDKQNLAVAAGTVVSTNAIDLGAAGTVPGGFQARGSAPHDLGRGADHLELLVQVTETFVGAGASLQVQVITDDVAALSSPTVLQSSAVIPVATLVAGYQFRVALPVGIEERYFGVQYIISGAAMTAGKITATLVADKQTTTI